MKFTSLSVLAVCAISNVVTADKARPSLRKNKNTQRRAAMQTKKLLQKATRVIDAGRRRVEADQQDAAEGEQDQSFLNFEDYPMAFEVRYKTCLPLPASSEQSAEIFAYSDDMQALAASGMIGAQQSYVLFDVCTSTAFSNPFEGNTRTGSSTSSSSQTCDLGTYMIDLPSWVDIATNEDMETYNEQGMTYDDAYCEACAASTDFCQAGSIDNLLAALENYQIDASTLSYFDLSLLTGDSSDSTYVYSAGQDSNATSMYSYPKFTTDEGQIFGISANANGNDEGGNNGGGDQEGGGMSLLVSCSVCQSRCSNYNSTYSANQDADGQQDQAEEGEEEEMDYAQLTQQISECMATESFLNDDADQAFPLYAGWMCSTDSNSIQAVMFLDEQCITFELQKDFATAINETEYASILNGSYNYMKSLNKETFALYQTPTPMSWADAFTNVDSIMQFVQGLGTDDIEQQYYYAAAGGQDYAQNGDGDGDADNADQQDDLTYEEMWWQALFQGWNLADAVDEDLANIVGQQAIDLETCGGTYGQVAYADANGTEVYYNASSVLYLQEDNNNDDLTAPCSIVSAMAGDYSSINLVATSSSSGSSSSGSSGGSSNWGGSSSGSGSGSGSGSVNTMANDTMEYVKQGVTHMSREGRIVLITLSVIVGVFCSLWIVDRCCCSRNKSEGSGPGAESSVKEKHAPLIDVEEIEKEEKPAAAAQGQMA